jgi:HEAT repeat protein
VAIKRSSAQEVAALLRDLQAGDDDARETAVARLSVIGTRAVEGLVGVLSSAAPLTARLAALGALEAIGDARAIDPAFAALMGPDAALSVQAASVLRSALDSARGDDVLDRLTAVALDLQRPDHTRLAALSALQALPPRITSPIWRRLADDPSPAMRAAAGATGPDAEMAPAAALEAASAGRLPDDADSVRRWIGAGTAEVSLPVLHRLVEAIRAREAETEDPPMRIAWMTARAAAHLALANRGSRVALYDLRETIGSGAPAPVEMLRALEVIGDRSCLEPIAGAFARLAAASAPGAPGAPESGWWRQHLATAFRAISAREKMTERHAVVKQIRARWPDAAIDLLGPARR